MTNDRQHETSLAQAGTVIYYIVQAEYRFQQCTLNAPNNGLYWLWTFSDHAEAEQYVEDLHDGRRKNGNYILRHGEYARPVYTIFPMSEEQLDERVREDWEKEKLDSDVIESWLNWRVRVGRKSLEESRRLTDKIETFVIANTPAALRSRREAEFRKARERENRSWTMYPPRHR